MKNNHEFEEKAIIKAWKDPAYRKKLLNHPKEALEEIGCKVPKNMDIKIYEAKENCWTFVLPASPSDINQLSESELKKMAAAGYSIGCGNTGIGNC